MTDRMTVAERRARLVRRHHLARTAATATKSVAALVAMHSSDPASPYLATRARMSGFAVEDLDRALFDDRTLRRMHAMRRTLFIVPSPDAALFDAAAGTAIAERERNRLEQWLSREAGAGGDADWLAHLETEVLAILADGTERRTTELAAAVPGLQTQITVGSGKWSARVPLSSRLLYIMAMDGRIVRARPAGSWRSSQYHWAAAHIWFNSTPEPMEPAAGRKALLDRYLAAHGPATMVDIRWWTGWTARQTGAAIEAAGAVPVGLEDGSTGYVVAADMETTEPSGRAVALLPGLDSTPMGWKERSWYLGDHAGPLFDRNGNVGPTVWLDGRIVGGWGQRPDGEVVCRLLEDVGREAAGTVEAEADELTSWMGGVAVTPRFRTPLERELSS